jgi:hypothetical protein
VQFPLQLYRHHLTIIGARQVACGPAQPAADIEYSLGATEQLGLVGLHRPSRVQHPEAGFAQLFPALLTPHSCILPTFVGALARRARLLFGRCHRRALAPPYEP